MMTTISTTHKSQQVFVDGTVARYPLQRLNCPNAHDETRKMSSIATFWKMPWLGPNCKKHKNCHNWSCGVEPALTENNNSNAVEVDGHAIHHHEIPNPNKYSARVLKN